MKGDVQPKSQEQKRLDAQESEGGSGVGEDLGNGNERFNDYTNNTVSGWGSYCTVEGQRNSTSNSSYVHICGYYNTARNSSYSIIGGDTNNVSSTTVVVGGGSNTIGGNASCSATFGRGNTVTDGYCSLVSGENNTISTSYSIVGGSGNTVENNSYYIIVGGLQNTVSGSNYALVGGEYNAARGMIAGILAGWSNTAYGDRGITVGYGNENNADSSIMCGEHNEDNAESAVMCGTYNENTGTANNSVTCGEGNVNSAGSSIMCGRYGQNSSYRIAVGEGSSGNPELSFYVNTLGNVYAAGSYNTIGADYAEFFEWADGNPDGEDRRGMLVSLDGDKLIPAHGEDIIGAVSANPSIIGNSCAEHWRGKYKTDIFGCEILDENGEHILSDDYDKETEYVPRSERSEWAAVGLVGRLIVTDNGECTPGGYVSARNGMAVPARTRTNTRCLKRADSTHVEVLIA